MNATATFPVEINISEPVGLTRQRKAVRMGIPFPVNQLHKAEQLTLLNDQGQVIPFQTNVLNTWHDGSIRWLLLDFFVTCKANSQIIYHLDKQSNNKSPHPTGFSITQADALWTVNTGTCTFHINTKQFLPFSRIESTGHKTLENLSTCVLKFDTNSQVTAPIENIQLIEDGALRKAIQLEGTFKNPNNADHSLNFSSQLTFYQHSTLCDLSISLHNPNAARHLGGFWDLGDPGSTFFESLSIKLNIKNNDRCSIKDCGSTQWHGLKTHTFNLRQDSSGGDNWNHRIHSDKNLHRTVHFRGYQLHEQNKLREQGDRISPVIHCESDGATLFEASIKQFWQNFPKAIERTHDALALDLFPQLKGSSYELQGGEKKTHQLSLQFFSETGSLEEHIQPLHLSLKPEHYYASHAIYGLTNSHRVLQQLIQHGIEGENNFYYKREKADEYGWRNFGDLWADHETLEHGNDDSLVSHYNNQYDPIYGFIRQYMKSGDPRWFELMDDLAHHVNDIDIYHTDQDRLEYNHGLFWHTDHYLDGVLCTHRTFSKSHMEIDHVEQSGGGPGSEHCYTTGLLHHYFLTGHQASKDNVLKLAEWAKYTNEGTFSVLEFVLKFLKKDLPKFKRLLKGEYLFKYSFPLNRGTGNYINTLIDAYLLEPDGQKLHHIADVIKQTIGPNDPIQKRGLMDDIELNWHYTVFLQSIARYLSTKEALNQIEDDDYQYALQSFTHYAKWVVENEQPYLDNKDKLVYPNDTWVGQDLRKANILSTYLKYCPRELTEQVQNRCEFFIDYIEQHFRQNINHTTRILALLMQNEADPTKAMDYDTKTGQAIKTNSRLTINNLLWLSLKALIERLLKIKLKNEIQWIKNRIN